MRRYSERYTTSLLPFSMPVCELDEFSCRDGGGCVSFDSICDSVNDCDDMSDESSEVCGE